MRVFNRVVMTLLFAGLFVLGLYTVVYSFDLLGRRLTSLPISDFSASLEDFVTRGVVEEEVSTVTEQVPDVLGTSVGVKARRSPGAQVDLEARVRQGEDLETIRSALRTGVQEHLSEKGLPVSKLNVNLVEADPRQTKTRVQ